MSQDAYILVGAVAGAFGVKGEVRIKPFTADPDGLFAYAPFVDEHGAVVLTIKSWRPIKDGFAAFVEQATTREEAQALKSLRLHVARERLPATDEDEFYHADLVGLAVKDLEGRPLGEVRSVQNYGATDLLEIWKTPGVTEIWFLPFTKDAAPHVDLGKGEIVADPPEGLMPVAERPA